jgi:hypothetical protein
MYLDRIIWIREWSMQTTSLSTEYFAKPGIASNGFAVVIA